MKNWCESSVALILSCSIPYLSLVVFSSSCLEFSLRSNCQLSSAVNLSKSSVSLLLSFLVSFSMSSCNLSEIFDEK